MIFFKIGGGKLLKICYVSRVEQSKGLDILLEVASKLSALSLRDNVKIDIYGQMKDDYYNKYLSNIDMYEYKGVLQPVDVISALKSYDALIFPTHYDGEGCPGILVEAMSASIAIIASDWKYNSEFVVNGINGFLCDTYNADAYVQAIVALLDNTSLSQMQKHSYLMSGNYSAGTAIGKVKSYLSCA